MCSAKVLTMKLSDPTDTIKWPKPSELVKEQGAQPYPVDSLPDVLREAIEEVEDETYAPMSMVAQSFLVALSTAAQAHYDVARDSQKIGPASVYMITIAGSGARKSAADAYAMQAIEMFEEQQSKNYYKEKSEWQPKFDAWDVSNTGIKNTIKRMAGQGKDTTDEEKRLVELAKKKPKALTKQELLTEDTTPAALIQRLKQWPAATLHTDEGGTVFCSHGMGGDSASDLLTKLNKFWGGKGIKVDRKEGGKIEVKNPRVSVGIMVQKEVLDNFLSNSGKLARGSGFLSRCLISNTKPAYGERGVDPAREVMAKNNAIQNVFKKILNTRIATPTGKPAPSVLRLTDDAYGVWRQYANDVEKKLADGAEYSDMRDVASKSAENAARLAALLQIVNDYDIPSNTPSSHEVGVQAMQQGVELARWYLAESKRYLFATTMPEELQDAVDLEKWLLDRLKITNETKIKRNLIRQSGPVGVRNSERLAAALEELTLTARAQVITEGRTTYVLVNPALLLD